MKSMPETECLLNTGDYLPGFGHVFIFKPFFLKATKWKKGVISVPVSESYFFKIWTRPNSAQSLLLVVFSILNGVLRIKLRLIICKESTCLLYYLSRFFKNYFKIENNLGPDSAGVKMLTWYLSTPIQIPHMI